MKARLERLERAAAAQREPCRHCDRPAQVVDVYPDDPEPPYPVHAGDGRVAQIVVRRPLPREAAQETPT
jgi:hypothetical protein